jgi:hypothetical protein
MFNVSISGFNTESSAQLATPADVLDFVVYALTVAGFDLNVQIMPMIHDLVEKSGEFLVILDDTLETDI